MKFPPVPEGVVIDEEKLAEQIKTDPYLRGFDQKIAALDARREKAKIEHGMAMEGMTIEKKVIKRRAWIRRNQLRRNAVRKAKQELKNVEDEKAAEEFKKELREQLQ